MTREDYGTAYQNGFKLTVRFLLSRGLCSESALESAQAAWARGWEVLMQLRDENMIIPWINSIALNHSRKCLRKSKRHRSLLDMPGGEAPNVTALDLKRVLALVPAGGRRLLETHMQGASIFEIARDWNVSEAAIRVRLLRARKMAKSKMESACRQSTYYAA